MHRPIGEHEVCPARVPRLKPAEVFQLKNVPQSCLVGNGGSVARHESQLMGVAVPTYQLCESQ